MKHPQPTTPIVSNNQFTVSFTNGTVKQLLLCAIDMHFYWIRDCVKQGQFLVFWKPETHNLAGYTTEYHPTYHHRQICPIYLKPTAKDIHNDQ